MEPWGPDLQGAEEREQLRGARTGEDRGGARPRAGKGWVGTPVLGSVWPEPEKSDVNLASRGRGRGAKTEGGSQGF